MSLLNRIGKAVSKGGMEVVLVGDPPLVHLDTDSIDVTASITSTKQAMVVDQVRFEFVLTETWRSASADFHGSDDDSHHHGSNTNTHSTIIGQGASDGPFELAAGQTIDVTETLRLGWPPALVEPPASGLMGMLQRSNSRSRDFRLSVIADVAQYRDARTDVDIVVPGVSRARNWLD